MRAYICSMVICSGGMYFPRLSLHQAETARISSFMQSTNRWEALSRLRPQGWINNKLAAATIADGRCSHLRFWGHKRDRASRRFVDCMNKLTRAVLAEQENVCGTPGPPPS